MLAIPGRCSPPLLIKALLVGSGLGVIDTALTYLTGSAPFLDVIAVFGIPFVLTLAIAILGGVPRFSDEKYLDTMFLALPVVVFGLRGCVFGCDVSVWATIVRWTPTLVLLIVALFLSRRAWTPPMFGAVAMMLHALAALGFAERTDQYRALNARVIASFVVLIALGAGVLVLKGRRGDFQVRTAVRYAALLGTSSLAIAGALRSSPPRLPRPAGASGKAGQKPSVLLIVMDTVRADHLSVYGYRRATTPHLERLARHSVVFQGATTNATYSLASHASLLTGLLPSEHGAHIIPRVWAARHPRINVAVGSFRLRQTASTLAEELQDGGYVTGGISANDVYLAPWTGLQRGFQQFAAHARRRYRIAPLASPFLCMLAPRFGSQAFNPQDTWGAAEVVNGAIEWTRATRNPFFLFLNIFDAHEPYTPAGGSRFRADGLGSDENEIPEYDEEIWRVDAAIGRLLDDLRARNIYDSALIIFTADHGQYFGERGLKGHPHLLYEPVLHVPLIVKLPGQTQARRVERRFGLHEVRGLVRQVVDRPAIPPALEESEDARILAESWAGAEYEDPTDPEQHRPDMVAVYSGRWKLIHRRGGTNSLFDLAADPAEAHDLWGSSAAPLPAVSENLVEAARQAVAGQHRRDVPDPTPEMVERLRALGYVN